jgi:phage gpG-like protein
MSVEAEITAHVQSFRINEGEMRAFLTGENSAIAKDLALRAIKVEETAKMNATGRPGPNVITGRLRGSITWRLGVDALSMYADIGTNVEYALYVEMGTSRSQAYPFLVPALDSGR